MRIDQKAIIGTMGVAALVATFAVGCGGSSSTSASSSSSAASSATGSAAETTTEAAATDYSALLIKDTDIEAPIVFTGAPPTLNPNGAPGVATAFSDEDGSHVIGDTILVLPDAAAAAAALESSKAVVGTNVTGTPGPSDIGTGGTLVEGNSPDGTKGVTVLLFTVNNALVTLEFDGPVDSPAPPDFVHDIGTKQAAAIQAGLPS